MGLSQSRFVARYRAYRGLKENFYPNASYINSNARIVICKLRAIISVTQMLCVAYCVWLM